MEAQRHLQILVVDDEEPFRKVISTVLKDRGGFDVQECESGEETIEALRRTTFDVVILDYRMEAVSGLNVLQWMLEQKIETPVIVLTGAGSEHVAVEAMKLGAYDYLRKDLFDHHHLPLVVRGVYERFLFKKEREGLAKNLRDRERDIASLDLLRNAIGLSADLVNRTLSSVLREIDRYDAELKPLVRLEGYDIMNRMTEELRKEYQFISVMSKSLSELSDLMYQRFKGIQDTQTIEEALQSKLKELQDRGSPPQKTDTST